jgi:UDP-N-acetylglucosamine 2-epimerase (non-hydrolysing)
VTTDIKVLRRDQLRDVVCVVVGTRPSIVKQSATIRELTRRRIPHFVIHTGQHYSYELDAAFFKDLELPPPKYHLDTVRNFSRHGEQTAEMLRGVEAALIEERPKAVLVGGDANCNLAAALAARKLNINVCHEEAGLRSYDWLMPEEHNRRMIDHISEFLFAPNDRARATLESERVPGRIIVTGSVIVDAVHENVDIARRRSRVHDVLGSERRNYILMTLHHEESVDYVEVLSRILDGIDQLSQSTGMRVIFPAHPRTDKRIREFGLERRVAAIAALSVVPPQGYFDFLTLLADARAVLTDSGGVIQESAILKVPCLTLGQATEWQETVHVGANQVVGTDAAAIARAGNIAINRSQDWPDPFGTRGPAARIVDVLTGIRATEERALSPKSRGSAD